MKKVLIFIICLCLYGCQSIDEDALRSEIISEIESNQSPDIFEINDYMKELTTSIQSYSVSVINTLADDQTVYGSGVIFRKDSTTYYILTNEHVVRYNDLLEVFLPNANQYTTAVVIKEDAELDLAILEIHSQLELSVCEVVSQTISEGEMVFAVGTPMELEYANTVTQGIISNIYEDVLQHDAAINSGSSGGPLFNIYGELIGLNTYKLNSTYSGGVKVSVEGMSFAIRLDVLLDFIVM